MKRRPALPRGRILGLDLATGLGGLSCDELDGCHFREFVFGIEQDIELVRQEKRTFARGHVEGIVERHLGGEIVFVPLRQNGLIVSGADDRVANACDAARLTLEQIREAVEPI